MGPLNKIYLYFSKHTVRDIISKTVLKIKMYEKYKFSRMLLISPVKHIDFINKYSMDEYDNFENVFSSIYHK